ncbi:MFS transporter [Clostridium estertheticum]|uniref:MFS transporter n=1 Tax=Clostridium estertheticum TaxID=238834 RepID=UPI001C7CBE4F|nr:MFS transporter [Clostridium estertheticum]MBX4269458.1 MFS transporter [Clostridium estertheticum]WLC79204.1 MFS transporter [Clostridium estertheticum]
MKIFKYNNELKNFYILQLGQFISQFGSKMTSFGLIMWSYEQSGSVLYISSLTVCSLLPSILLSFFAGSFIDVWNKKKILLIANAIAIIFSLITLILLFFNQLDIRYLYLINFTLGVVDAFQGPTSDVVISLIVPKKYYTQISGLRSFAISFTTTLAPITATSFYVLLGMKVIIIVDLGTFLFSFISLLSFVYIPNNIIEKQDKKESFVSNCKQGITYIVNRKDILHLIIFMGFVNFIAAIYSCNFTPMILLRNGNNKFELGIVSSTICIAGIIGSILVTVMKQPKKRIPVIINTMTFSFLVCNSMLGIGHNYYIWMIAVFAGNCLVPFLTANVEYIMRTKIPIEMQGRVFSARNTLQYLSIPIGYMLGGLLTDKIFEPFMNNPSTLQRFFSYIVGNGRGSGNGLVYISIGLIGFLGCCFFKFDKHLKKLDD